ncbi:MAG: DUF3782 domain-containing protein [Candidatus Aenigmatarchaeota archaeon]
MAFIENYIIMSLKEEFIELLEKDKSFRFTIAGLIGYKDMLERLEEHSKRFEEHDRKFNEILKTLNEHTKRLEEHDKKFNEIIIEIRELRKNFEILSNKVEVTIGSMGMRWGIDLERTILKIFKETLEAKGIEPGKVEKFRFKDENGSITGIKGKIIDVDVLIKDDKLYIIEVKSAVEIDHVEYLIEKASIVEKILKRKVNKVFLIAVNIDKEAYDRAKEMNIDVIYGKILEY